MTTFLLLNGPNLNRLGLREPNVYGDVTLKKVEQRITMLAQVEGIELVAEQSNHEGKLIDLIHQAAEYQWDGILFNPAAYTHTSYAIRDAILSVDLPVIEIHISNVHTRESFRHHSVISPVTIGQIVGFGVFGYELALRAMIDYLKEEK